MSLKDLPPDARPREKLIARGPSALSDAELLALLLRTGTAGRGVLQMAHELLAPPAAARSGAGPAGASSHHHAEEAAPARPAAGKQAGSGTATGGFGGLSGLLRADMTQLARFKGLGGTAKRAELAAVLEIARRAMAEQLREREAFGSPEDVKHYLQLHLAHKAHEVFAVLFLDSQNRLLQMKELFRGTLTQTSVYPREVVLEALHCHAAAVVLAHNHPSGTVQPSRADETLTQALKAALALVDVRVLDHVIVAPGQALSMAERGLL